MIALAAITVLASALNAAWALAVFVSVVCRVEPPAVPRAQARERWTHALRRWW